MRKKKKSWEKENTVTWKGVQWAAWETLCSLSDESKRLGKGVCLCVCVCVGGVFEITGADLELAKGRHGTGSIRHAPTPRGVGGGSAGARSENKHAPEDAARDTSNGGLRL